MTPSLPKSKRVPPDPRAGPPGARPVSSKADATGHSAEAAHPALCMALGDLLRAHVPGALLLARVGGAVLRFGADTVEQCGLDLEPPGEWLEGGEMTWLARDGELLGLLWSDQGPVPANAVEVLTMLLAASRPDGAGREAEVLVTQLPVATAWLTPDLVVRRVSRPFLELLNLSDAAALNRTVAELLPGRPGLMLALAQAAAGHSVCLPDELLSAEQQGRAGQKAPARWVRGEARPYLGSWGAGVMLTLQDVSGEYERGARVSALLDTRTPAALLTEDGTVLHASPGLLELASQAAGQPDSPLVGAPLWAWSAFESAASAAVRELVRRAAGDGSARADVTLSSGEILTLKVRRSTESGLLVAEGLGMQGSGAASAALVSQLLALSEDATVLVDALGRTQLISDRAAALLGVEASRLVGLGLSRVLGELGVKMFSPDGEALPLPDWRTLELPFRQEVLLALPGQSLRHMELRATAMGLEAGHKAGQGALLLSLRDVTVLRRAEAKMHHDARHDSLTGLLNRAGLREDLGGVHTETPTSGALVCVNIDGFAALNAALGRVTCDRILISLAARLSDLVGAQGSPAQDSPAQNGPAQVKAAQGGAARLEGGTFAVSLPGMDAHDALEAVELTLSAPLRSGQRELPLTYALGVSALTSAPAEEQLSNAELAMDHARSQGRGGIGFFTPALRAGARTAYALEEDLRGALKAQEFTLLYQPVVGLKTGQVQGAEALLRWQHPELGLLPPLHFLEAAGRSDLLTQIGEWVVAEAVAGRGRMRAGAAGSGNWRVSVNLSLDELRRSEGLRRLLPLLSAEGAPDFEVSAGSLIDHSEETLDMLEQLRAHGARLCVDDFGDNASSLSALIRFPLSTIKLHPTLTARLPHDRKVITLLQATIDLAHRLGMEVSAVGVERTEQLDILRELGCDAAQGYVVCPPLPETELMAWLAQN